MGFLNLLNVKLKRLTVAQLQACIQVLQKLEDIFSSTPLKPPQPDLYKRKVILAPMVKLGRLPLRLLALKYGADLVYTDEIFSKSLRCCKRTENERLGLVNFTIGQTHLFQTCREERNKVILQMGTNDPDEALEAAKLVQNDVLGIDVNFGCPTPNAQESNTGAFLLDNPDLVVRILRKLVNNLSVPVTCKIRVLPNFKETLDLVRKIEDTGVSALGVHGRLRTEKRNTAVRMNEIKAIAEAVSIPVIANGGSLEYIHRYEEIIKFGEVTNSSSVMVAQSAIKNTSVFCRKGILPIEDVIRDYATLAIQYEYSLPCILDALKEIVTRNFKPKNMPPVYDCLRNCETYAEVSKLLQLDIVIPKPTVEEHIHVNGIYITMKLPFMRRNYTIKNNSPKSILVKWATQNNKPQPMFEIIKSSPARMYTCKVHFEGKIYHALIEQRDSRFAEHASCVVCLRHLGLHDGRKQPEDQLKANDALREFQNRARM